MRPSRIAWPGVDARPSHITALRNLKLADGSGRRYIDAAVSAAPQRYGSSTEVISNSAPGGTSSGMRINPFDSNRLNALARRGTDETSAASQLEPSLVRKIGSSPFVRSNRLRSSPGVMVQPCAGWWHVAQL